MRPLRFLAFCLLIVLLLVLAASYGWFGLGRSSPYVGPETGAPTTWSAQLSSAFDFAKARINDPILVAAIADPVGGPPKSLRQDQAFEMEFLFVDGTNPTSDSSMLYVDLNDSQPSSTVRKKDKDGFIPQTDIDPNLDKYRKALADIKISARDAYTLTLSDASATLRPKKGYGLGYSVNPYLHLLPEFSGVSTAHLIWSIYYYSPDSSTRIDYLIDASTGAMLQRKVTP